MGEGFDATTDRLRVDNFIVEGEEEKFFNHNLFAIDGSSHAGGVPVGESFLKNAEVRTILLDNDAKEDGIWIILDYNLSYDYFSFRGLRNLVSKELGLKVNIRNYSNETVKLNGEIEKISDTYYENGLLGTSITGVGRSLLSGGIDGGLGWASGALSKFFTENEVESNGFNLSTYMDKELDDSNRDDFFDELRNQEIKDNVSYVRSQMGKDQTTVTGKLLTMAAGHLPSLSNAIFQGIAGSEITTSKELIRLEGYIESENPLNTYRISLSGNPGSIPPYFVRRSRQNPKSQEERNVGLFNYVNPPQMHINAKLLMPL